MKIIKHIFSFLILSLLSCFVIFNATGHVIAGNLWDMQDDEIKEGIAKPFDGDTENPVDIRHIVINVINVFLTILGIIFLVLIIWAGYKWMTSMGNEEELKTAKAQILTAIIGFVIIMMSYIIVKFVDNTIRKDFFDNPW